MNPRVLHHLQPLSFRFSSYVAPKKINLAITFWNLSVPFDAIAIMSYFADFDAEVPHHIDQNRGNIIAVGDIELSFTSFVQVYHTFVFLLNPCS